VLCDGPGPVVHLVIDLAMPLYSWRTCLHVPYTHLPFTAINADPPCPRVA
jgi:hypothetical protein